MLLTRDVELYILWNFFSMESYSVSIFPNYWAAAVMGISFLRPPPSYTNQQASRSFDPMEYIRGASKGYKIIYLVMWWLVAIDEFLAVNPILSQSSSVKAIIQSLLPEPHKVYPFLNRPYTQFLLCEQLTQRRRPREEPFVLFIISQWITMFSALYGTRVWYRLYPQGIAQDKTYT